MIERMKKVYVVSTVSGKENLLVGLRDLGLLHLSEKKSADRSVSERFISLTKTSSMLQDYLPEKKKGQVTEKKPLLSDNEFEKLFDEVQAAQDKKADLAQQMNGIRSEIERIEAWGAFDPQEIRELAKAGYSLHFYRMSEEQMSVLRAEENVKYLCLASQDRLQSVAIVGDVPESVQGTEFPLPEKGLAELKKDLETCSEESAACDRVFTGAAEYLDSFQVQMLAAQNSENYSAASETAVSDEDFVWITGYIPEDDMDKFRQAAAAGKWAYLAEDPAEDDDQIPTKVRYSKVSKLIKPVFDILGILPGYRETDISLWFFLFFILFFAMIIGDAGYGCLVLAGTVAFAIKTKKKNDAVFLLTVLSVATILWGAVTGTWFGMESAMNVPLLRAMVIPSFANYPDYFGVTALAQQNAIMKFSFSIGAIQMALGSLLAIRKKLAEKNLSWVADLGWLVAIVAMYLLSLYLVIGENIPVKPVFGLIGVAFALVVIFGGMAPDKTFAQGLKSGLADAFTVFLNTISCFGNVMSYIRLFAVGMAGLAISQSFNNIAAGFKGPLVIVAILVILIGHGLNIIMCFLSVVVHGVRLNVLEFSGQVGLEWTGISYDPFKENDKIVK